MVRTGRRPKVSARASVLVSTSSAQRSITSISSVSTSCGAIVSMATRHRRPPNGCRGCGRNRKAPRLRATRVLRVAHRTEGLCRRERRPYPSEFDRVFTVEGAAWVWPRELEDVDDDIALFVDGWKAWDHRKHL